MRVPRTVLNPPANSVNPCASEFTTGISLEVSTCYTRNLFQELYDY